jgi:hypothetical protein
MRTLSELTGQVTGPDGKPVLDAHGKPMLTPAGQRAAAHAIQVAVAEHAGDLLLQAGIHVAKQAGACDQICRQRCGCHGQGHGDGRTDGQTPAQTHGSLST